MACADPRAWRPPSLGILLPTVPSPFPPQAPPGAGGLSLCPACGHLVPYLCGAIQQPEVATLVSSACPPQWLRVGAPQTRSLPQTGFWGERLPVQTATPCQGSVGARSPAGIRHHASLPAGQGTRRRQPEACWEKRVCRRRGLSGGKEPGGTCCELGISQGTRIPNVEVLRVI